MKPLYRKLPAKLESSFSARHDIMPNFGNVWHYHEELELHYTIRGEGVRFIGDNISTFSPGEIILVGEKLSHAWRCKEEYYQNNPDYNIEAIVLQFLPDCLGRPLLQLPESYLLPKLFERAKSGLIVKGRTKDAVAELMHDCVKENGLGKIIALLQILKILAESDECETIVKTKTTFHQSNEADNIRLNNIFNHTHAHYKENITLEEVANIANLSVTSFCRYFKTMTRKTYYDFLVEIRISHACRLLVENKLPTEVICFECGFNNVSNFYRHFKKVMGLTPLEYKKRYLSRN
ncbi:AraC-like DNA-binding protein [Sphingobacterium allocomposti]|jgi:AraC-like DNA-binding protein|uniref:AraC-like DNA-binding protein n=1 Tax=Sphingobacterium allocomposti TaxID=415956 RepID=A0A5S5DIX1_9SPHI|nr:AraC family transcriptional regulator [Sphingobacterium composti Yoo et al. 2007 non Ten et al. 2007]TYP95877.1 AraC-like DNA-binding protein [Sphingobacterium composti Yoo et al. 2007 non Ten et al. 2007]HLS95834.1 AraC family transcriptional regulator [Sphingobacterium sp.]